MKRRLFLAVALAATLLISGIGRPAFSAAEIPLISAKITSETFRALELRNIGPALTPGRIQDIAVDPRNRSVWYVAVGSGGLWKTVNRGLTWQPIFDQGGSYSLGCVTLDPANPDVVWLGTGENVSTRSVSFGDGIYKSTDGGATWKVMGLRQSEHIAKIIVHPKDSKTVFVACQGPLWAPGGERGLYKTSDGGQTWTPILTISENTGVTDVVLDPRNPDVMYAAAYQRRRHVGLLVGGGPEAGIYKSVDGGAKWTKLTEGLPKADIGRIGLAISPQNPDIVYALVTAAGKAGGFFRSADKGATWVKQNSYVVVDPQYYCELYPDPRKLDRIYFVDTNMNVTSDGGKTMTPVTWNIHVDHHAIAFDPNDANYMLVGNDGGLYETYDNGRNWRHFNNMPIMQFYHVGIDNALPFYNVYGGSQDNGTVGGPSRTINRLGIRTSDWGVFGGGDGMQPRVDPKNPDIVYSQSQNAAISRFDKRTGANAGIQPRLGGPRGGARGAGAGGNASTSASAVRWNWNTPLIISPHSPSRLYLAGSRLFRSEDRGSSWTAISPDLTRQINRDTLPVMGKIWGPTSVTVTKNLWTTDLGVSTALGESPVREGLLYVGTDDGLIQVSEDGGKNWRKIERFPGVPEQTFVSDVYASWHDAGTVYATFDNHQRGDYAPYILRSDDQGKKWTSIAGNLPGRNPVWSVVEDPMNKKLLFAGTEFGLYFTVDGGQMWHKLRNGAPTIAFRDLEIQQRESDLVCATYGRGFYILDDYSPLRYLTPETLVTTGTLFPPRQARQYTEVANSRSEPSDYVAPNPPYGAYLNYYLGKDLGKGGATVALSITDIAGKEIRRLTGPAGAGIQRVVWDLRDNQSGAGMRRGGGEPEEEEAADPEEAEREEERQALAAMGVERPAEMEAEREAEHEAEREAEREADREEAQPQSADTRELQQMGSAAAATTSSTAATGTGRRGGRGNAGGMRRGGGMAATATSGTLTAGTRGGRGGAGGGAGVRGGGGRGGRGMSSGRPVEPGKYKVTLGLVKNGQLVPLGQSQVVEVVPLNAGPEADRERD